MCSIFFNAINVSANGYSYIDLLRTKKITLGISLYDSTLDFNQDNIIDIKDIIYLKKSIFDEVKEKSTIPVEISIEQNSFSAQLYNNSSSKAIIDMLPISFEMNELNGNEKYYYLSNSIPTDAYKVQYIHKGDIMLYGSNCIVIFYEDFETSYSYTPIGFLEDCENLKEILGDENVEVTFSLK